MPNHDPTETIVDGQAPTCRIHWSDRNDYRRRAQ